MNEKQQLLKKNCDLENNFFDLRWQLYNIMST